MAAITKVYGVPLNTPDSKLLRIKVVHAKDLIKDIFGSCNPFVQVGLFKKNDEVYPVETARTITVRKTTNPVYNEDFLFNVHTGEHKLIIDVYDESKKRNDFMGRVNIPLNNSRIIISNEDHPNARNQIDFNLERKTFLSKVKGKLTLSIHFISSVQAYENELNHSVLTPAMQNMSLTPNTPTVNTPSSTEPNSITSPESGGGLPEGWEQRSDQNGRVYYIDHITRRTTWIRPTSNARSAYSSTAAMERHQINDSSSEASSLASNSENSSAPSSAPPTPTPQIEAKNEEPVPNGWEISYTDKGRMFFIDHVGKVTTWVDPRTNKASPMPALDFEKRIGPLPPGWEERRHHDGRIFYIDHSNKATQWEDPRLKQFAGPAVPYSRDYKHKFETFRKHLPASPSKPSQFGATDKYLVRVRRGHILEDAFNKIMHEKNPELLRLQLWVEFEGEKSYDYGGVSREFFHVLSKEIFNPYYGLFEYSAIDNYTLQINPNSGLVNEHHLNYYYFIGRVVGMASYHNRLIDGFFIRPFYKMMLNKPIVLQDIEAVDGEYYKSMKFIMDTDDVESLDLVFISESDVYGQKVEHELKPNGKNIKVTNENKKEFIELIIQWRFVQRIEKQMSNFMKGFNEIVPQRCIQIFDPKEFELLLSGLGDVNIKDWQMNTVFKGEYNMQHRVIQWFWMAMYSFPNELRLRFLQFVTGTSRVPMNGFAELQGSNGYQKFTIQSWGDYKQLPRAHTCFNRLDLPPYRSYEELREKLLLAIENSEGFDGVD